MNFTIKKTNHYSQLMPILLRKSHFGLYKVRIEFDKRQPTQDYYNKLIGFGCLNPRIRSERIGWRFLGVGKMEVCCYSETDYKHEFIEPIIVPIWKDLYGDDVFYVEFDVFIGNNKIWIESIYENKLFRSSHLFDPIHCMLPLFLCKPYHGGNPKAAQDYRITFEKID
jgi:hypothetical protein